MPETGPAGPLPATSDVELRIPADGAYVSVLRTTTAGLAARLDYTLDDIADLRMAVGEAAAMALEAAAGDLTVRFWLDDRTMTVVVSTPTAGPATIDETSFAWQVLTTLAREARASVAEDHLEIALIVSATPLGATS